MLTKTYNGGKFTAMKTYYTGVGSRETPKSICKFMTEIAAAFEQRGLILRSGGAPGADLAFEDGVSSEDNKEIWIPWKKFNGSNSKNLPIPEAFELASTLHPVWSRLNRGSRSLHARNCHQVLGSDLGSPSSFLLCWTEGGQIKGGTATAIKLAKMHNVPVLNFGEWYNVNRMYEALKDFLLINGDMYEV